MSRKIYVSGQARWGGRGWGAWAVAYPGPDGRYTMVSQKVSRKPVGSPHHLERRGIIHALEAMDPGQDIVVESLSTRTAEMFLHPDERLERAVRRHESVDPTRILRSAASGPMLKTRERAMRLAEIDEDHLDRVRRMQGREPAAAAAC